MTAPSYLDIKDNPKKLRDYPTLERDLSIFNLYRERMTDEKALSEMITLWANGATDHLYEIIVPKKWKDTEIGLLVDRLQHKGLEMGHGFIRDKTYTIEDFEELWELTKQIAVKIDESIGLKRQVDWGQY